MIARDRCLDFRPKVMYAAMPLTVPFTFKDASLRLVFAGIPSTIFEMNLFLFLIAGSRRAAMTYAVI